MQCVLCGRPMEQAAVMIGEYPVGPKCAQRANLLPLAKKKGGLVFPVVRRHLTKPEVPATLDLFAEVMP